MEHVELDPVLEQIVNPLEALMNLLFLIKHDRQNPEAISGYAEVAESQVRVLANIVQRGLEKQKSTLAEF